MKMYILKNQFFSTVKQLLLSLSQDGGLAVNDGTGEVTFTPRSSSAVNEMLALLANSPVGVGIAGQHGNYPIPEPGKPNQVLRDRAGYVIFDRYPGTTIADVYIDVEGGVGCNGRGYFVQGTGGNPVQYPPQVSLYHELTHVRHLVTQGFTNGLASAEADAIREENVLRQALNLDLRAGYAGGCNSAPPQKPTSGNTGGKGQSGPSGRGGGCFVATATLQSDRSDDLAFLRHLRDDILYSNPRARQFFDNFYSQYYMFSPALANAIRNNEALAEAIRDGIVIPYVNYLKLAASVPPGELPGDIPAPWRDFLLSFLDDFHDWATSILPPLDQKPEEYTDAQYSEDIQFVERYITRGAGPRSQYEE